MTEGSPEAEQHLSLQELSQQAKLNVQNLLRDLPGPHYQEKPAFIYGPDKFDEVASQALATPEPSSPPPRAEAPAVPTPAAPPEIKVRPQKRNSRKKPGRNKQDSPSEPTSSPLDSFMEPETPRLPAGKKIGLGKIDNRSGMLKMADWQKEPTVREAAIALNDEKEKLSYMGRGYKGNVKRIANLTEDKSYDAAFVVGLIKDELATRTHNDDGTVTDVAHDTNQLVNKYVAKYLPGQTADKKTLQELHELRLNLDKLRPKLKKLDAGELDK